MTLVELIVTITILAILGTIAIITLQSYTLNARDGVRVSDIHGIQAVIQASLANDEAIGFPDSPTDITYSGATLWKQGIFGKGAFVGNKGLSKIPVDPLTGDFYTLSVTDNQKEYQVGAILESADMGLNSTKEQESLSRISGSEVHTAYVVGNYNGEVISVSKDGIYYVLAVASIITSDLTESDIETIIQEKRLVVDGYYNIPHEYGIEIATGVQEQLNFINPGSLLVWSGNAEDLKNQASERITLLSNIQDAYTGTLTESRKYVSDLLSLQLDSNATRALEEGNNIVEYTLNLDLGYGAKSCSGVAHQDTKKFYEASTVPFLSSCDDIEDEFLCYDGSFRNIGDYTVVTNFNTYSPSCTMIPPANCNVTLSEGFIHPTLGHGIDDTGVREVIIENGSTTDTAPVSCYNGTVSVGTIVYGSLICDTGYVRFTKPDGDEVCMSICRGNGVVPCLVQ